MKFRVILISFLILAASIGAFGKRTTASDRKDKDKERGQKVDRTIAVDSAVTISLCMTSANITVRGWDRNEVAVRSTDGAQIEFRHAEAATPGAAVKKLEVAIFNKTDEKKTPVRCQAFSDVDMSVPKGATVVVQTRDGDLSVSEVTAVHAGTQNGDVEVDQVSRTIEVGSIGGSICLKDSSGRVSVSTAGGSVEAANLRPAEPSDTFEVVTTSGDISLMQVTHREINTKTVSGNLTMTGPLAAAGRYWFNSFSGDVTLAMPASASFKLTAKVSEDGEIITDFPLTLTQSTASASAAVVAVPAEAPVTPEADPPTPPAPPAKAGTVSPTAKVAPVVKVHIDRKIHTNPVITINPPKVTFTMRRIVGTHGTGDASISVASFSGTLRLEQN